MYVSLFTWCSHTYDRSYILKKQRKKKQKKKNKKLIRLTCLDESFWDVECHRRDGWRRVHLVQIVRREEFFVFCDTRVSRKKNVCVFFLCLFFLPIDMDPLMKCLPMKCLSDEMPSSSEEIRQISNCLKGQESQREMLSWVPELPPKRDAQGLTLADRLMRGQEEQLQIICTIVLSVKSNAKRCDAIHEAKIAKFTKATRTGGREFCRFVEKLLKGRTAEEVKRAELRRDVAKKIQTHVGENWRVIWGKITSYNDGSLADRSICLQMRRFSKWPSSTTTTVD